MKEGSSGDLVYLMFKGEVIVKDDSEVATVGGWRQGGVVNGEVETVCGFEFLYIPAFFLERLPC